MREPSRARTDDIVGDGVGHHHHGGDACTFVDLGLGTRVRLPAGWIVTKYPGELATVYFPLFFLGTERMPAPCRPGPRTMSSCQERNWFPPTWTTPDHGAVVLWSMTEFPESGPGLGLSTTPGRLIEVDRRPARVIDGSATDDCPPGSAHELTVRYGAFDRTFPGERLDMIACFGAHAPARDRAAVVRMLASLRVRACLPTRVHRC